MIPALLNPEAHAAKTAAEALAEDSRFQLHVLSPSQVAQAVHDQLQRGARRILIAGGDGTVAAAAQVVYGHEVELAILPAGTRNHFARSLNLGQDARQALTTAVEGPTRTVDVGFVNDHLFLNTSSVGAYIALVHTRARLRPYMGYYLAGAVASAAVLKRVPNLGVDLEIDGRHQRYQTPLVFVGVGQRDLALPTFGERVEGGASALHVIAIQRCGRARLLALAFTAAIGGISRAAGRDHVDSHLVRSCTIELPRRRVHVALDGETMAMAPPLQYRLASDALRVVAPPSPATA